MTAHPAVEFEEFGLAFARAGQDRAILRDTTISIPSGGLLLLVGESGSGKSTILKTITNLWDPREPLPKMTGRIRVLGHSLVKRYPRELRGQVQAVLQDEGLVDDLSPRANVELALAKAGRSRRLAPALLTQAGLERPPGSVAELSGGMRKRLAVARALAGEPALLVFDEPTAGLDHESAREIAQLIERTQRQADTRRTTIVITHDLHAFEGLADTVLRLDTRERTIKAGAASDSVSVDEGAPIEQPEADSEDFDLHGVRRVLLEVASASTSLSEAITRFPPVYPGLAARTTLRFVIESTFFLAIGCATVGGLATFFALRNNPLEGAFTASVLTGAGKVLVAVLIPLLGGFFFTARVAAGAAARLGTMKRTNQVAALRVMGVRPADYLLIPLVWAASLAMPITTLCGIVTTCVASCAAAGLVAGTSPFSWAQAFFAEVDRADIRFVLAKSILSGFLVAVLTYHLAMGPKRSGRDVGRAVNSSIVLGIYAVLAVHAVLTLIQFA